MNHEIRIAGLEDLDRAAKAFLEAIGDNTLVAFYAPMGAGKTTFTTALCKALGVREDAISSPTFAIVNEYRGGAGEPIYHFDFYRIERPEEALDIGLYDHPSFLQKPSGSTSASIPTPPVPSAGNPFCRILLG